MTAPADRIERMQQVRGQMMDRRENMMMPDAGMRQGGWAMGWAAAICQFRAIAV